jgi:hypothetical protein
MPFGKGQDRLRRFAPRQTDEWIIGIRLSSRHGLQQSIRRAGGVPSLGVFVVHATGSKIVKSQRKQTNNPNPATIRYFLQDNTLAKKTTAIKPSQKYEMPSRPKCE